MVFKLVMDFLEALKKVTYCYSTNANHQKILVFLPIKSSTQAMISLAYLDSHDREPAVQ